MKTFATLLLGSTLAFAGLVGAASAQNLTPPFNVGRTADGVSTATSGQDYVVVPREAGRSVYGARTPAQIDRYRGYEQDAE